MEMVFFYVMEGMHNQVYLAVGRCVRSGLKIDSLDSMERNSTQINEIKDRETKS